MFKNGKDLFQMTHDKVVFSFSHKKSYKLVVWRMNANHDDDDEFGVVGKPFGQEAND